MHLGFAGSMKLQCHLWDTTQTVHHLPMCLSCIQPMHANPSFNLSDDVDAHFSYSASKAAVELGTTTNDNSDVGGMEEHGGDRLIENAPPIIVDHHEQPFVRQEDCIEDTFLPDQGQTSDDHSEGSPCEMWKGRRFCDRESFRNTMKKFAMYNNFSLKHLKTSRMEVSARCGDQNCPWRIYASVVD